MSKYDNSIFILAGEPSGDRIGADLINDISKKGKFNFFGVGGEKMLHEGISSLYAMSDLSVMGFKDVLFRLPLLLWRLQQTAKYIIKKNPNIVILIDSQVFSALLAKKLRKKGYKKPILLYVAPSVWAWKPQRAKKLVGLFDEVLSILPFEVQVMKRLGGPKTNYVGHPALKDIISKKQNEEIIIALLPGSRKGEIERHMPLFKQLAQKLFAQGKIHGFIIPTLSNFHKKIEQQVKDWAVPIKIISEKKAKTEALQTVKLAVVSAGTITLELALAGIPMAGTYIPDRVQMAYYKKLGMPMIALPNIILGQKIIPEILPDNNLLENLLKAITELLENNDKYQAQLSEFDNLRKLMIKGEAGAMRQDPSTRVLAHLKM